MQCFKDSSPEMSTEIIRVNSFVRGYHDYLDIWQPEVGDEYSLKREPNNKKDANAVAVVRERRSSSVAVRRSVRVSNATKPHFNPNEISDDMEVIGHVPKLMALWLTKFLKRPTNTGTVVITSKWINRGAGYGVELPCEFKFQGDNFSSNWLKIKLKKEKFDVLN